MDDFIDLHLDDCPVKDLTADEKLMMRLALAVGMLAEQAGDAALIADIPKAIREWIGERRSKLC